MLFGKKFIPNPDTPRSGILPSRSGRGLIGNRALLKAVDALLDIESVGGTPTEFDISAVIPVVDIRAAGIQNPTPRFVKTSVNIGGQGQSFHVVFEPLERRLAVVLGAEAFVTFPAPVLGGNEIGLNWSLAAAVPNGQDQLVGVSGCAEYSGALTTNTVSLKYKTILGGDLGGEGNAPWMGSLKGMLWGQSFFKSGGDQLALLIDVQYFVANVPTNWPVGTLLEYRAWGLDRPESDTILKI